MCSVKTYLLLFAILPLLLSSCKKDKRIGPAIRGKVMDVTSGKPIPGAWVVLIEKEICYSWICPERVIGEDTTDSRGVYEFDFEEKDGYGYSLMAFAPRYFDSGRVGNSKSEKNNFAHIYLQPEAFLKVFVKNTLPVDLWDEIRISPYGASPGGGGIFQGMNIDTFTIGQVFGNSTTQLKYWVIKNMVKDTTEYTTTIYCPAFDTTTYQINY